MEYELRTATDADLAFLFDLHAAALGPYVALVWGWDEADQRQRFARKFDRARSLIVRYEREDVGAIAVERREQELYLASIEILPQYQGRGIGSALLRSIIVQADHDDVRVALQVLKVNPAIRLYERLGFVRTGETETHYLMLRATS